MRTLSFSLTFILQLSLTPKPYVAGVDWETQNVAFESNTTDRYILPPTEKTPQDLVSSLTYSDTALSSADLHEHVKPQKARAVPNSAKLWPVKALIMSESHCRLFGNVSVSHVIPRRYCESGLKMIWSLFQSEATRLVVKVITPLLEVVTMSLHLFSSLFKTVTPQSLVQIDSDRIDQHNTVSEVNVSYGHNVNVRDMWIYSDHQNIVILEDDPVVMESASFLFEKRPSVSTLLRYHKGALKVLRGSQTLLTRDSRVVLVGHGSKGSDGVARLGGYGPEELAKVVVAMKIEDGHLHTLSLVGCALGKDLKFAERLLRALISLNVETKLHLRSSALSVRPNGEKVTREEGVWRHKDSSKKVIAQLDQNGNLLTRVEGDDRGQVIPNYQGHALYIQTLEWPTHPQMFVSANLRKKYTSIDCLEGLTWSLFFEENERRRAPDYIPVHKQGNLTSVWLADHKPMEDIPIKHLTTILDLLVEIRYNAREDTDFDLYYVLNDCIFKVQRRTFYASLVGKYIHSNHLEEIEKFTDAFRHQKEDYSLQELRQGLKASEFNNFCRQTFQLQRCVQDCERWGHYFMAAVFSASVRNFRTFSLFLMSVIACEVGRSQGSDSSLCTAFVGDDHPMVGDDPWLERSRRGFYGCTVGKAEEMMTKRDTLDWLDQVVSKENAIFAKSKQMMSGVDHDQETELDIFGRVKVMNKYVFSSFLEFFRGTPEGKKLARGCRA
ncbi:uncharacterized protein LOC115131539 [Oncorhynchus nerka]|uniref:uncharacterized protein LOC115131539 n=1 Tax=Oncorhynchus nerka TaxID=8023 RepID=UPI001130A9F8|nr:uncharacterized protein LOC115131539 [Oncorhynchus nerka]